MGFIYPTMHRFALFAAAVCISWTSALQAQAVDPSEFFPLAVGNEWEYEHELVRPRTEDRPVDESETRVERYRILSSATV